MATSCSEHYGRERHDHAASAQSFDPAQLRDQHRLCRVRPAQPRLVVGAADQPRRLRPRRSAPRLPRFQGENFARNLAVVAQLQRLADEQRAAPSQLAIAWLLAQGDDIVPIPGAERRGYLEENVRALGVRLTPRDLAAIEQVAWRGVAAGERYGPAGMAYVNI
jgi:diketogulonate reductase-like aldo/keto reductase